MPGPPPVALVGWGVPTGDAAAGGAPPAPPVAVPAAPAACLFGPGVSVLPTPLPAGVEGGGVAWVAPPTPPFAGAAAAVG